MKPVIFLDMDGVLVDFISGACRLHSRDPEEVIANWPRNVWDICQVLDIPENEFWFSIDRSGEGFWMSLEQTSWAGKLVHLVKELSSEWYVVTAPSRSPSCSSGKVKWLQSFFGPTFHRFIFTRHKHLLANPNTILIDDNPENIDHFVEAGGQGILFPACHNSLYALAADPIPHIQSHLGELYGKDRDREAEQNAAKGLEPCNFDEAVENVIKQGEKESREQLEVMAKLLKSSTIFCG